jgi:hypothetical protein
VARPKKALLAENTQPSTSTSAPPTRYEIYVHANVRSLDEQIGSWNRNASVGIGAEELLHAYTVAFGKLASSREHRWRQAGCVAAGFTPADSVTSPRPACARPRRCHRLQVMKDGAIHAGADSTQVSVTRAEAGTRS